MTDKQREAIKELRFRGFSYGEIAKRLDMNPDSVKKFCHRHGIGGKAKDLPGGINDNKHCRNCGAEITQVPKRKRKIFCCDDCRRQWWNTHQYMAEKKAYYDFVCLNCGKPFRAYGNSRRKYCCHECYIQHRFGANMSQKQ